MLLDDVGLLSGDACKTLVAMKSSLSSTDSPASHHLSSPPTSSSLQHYSSISSSSQRVNHSAAVTSHYEDLASLAADDWLPSDADTVTWATVTDSGAHLTLPQSGRACCRLRYCSMLTLSVEDRKDIWLVN